MSDTSSPLCFAQTKQYYDKNSNVIKEMTKNNSPGAEETWRTTEYVFDAMGNALGVISRNPGGDSAVQYTYDTGNRMTSMRTGLLAYSETPEGGALTQYTYDANGQLWQVTDPLGQSVTYAYDFLGNPVPSQQKWTQKSLKKRNESQYFLGLRKLAAFIPRFT